MGIENDIRWAYLGETPPRGDEILPPYDPGRDEGRPSRTFMTVTTLAERIVATRSARYTCDHGRTTVTGNQFGRVADVHELPRAALALHAWCFPCACFRADWEGYFGWLPTQQALEAALRRAKKRLDANPQHTLLFEASYPIRPAWTDPPTPTGQREAAR